MRSSVLFLAGSLSVNLILVTLLLRGSLMPAPQAGVPQIEATAGLEARDLHRDRADRSKDGSRRSAPGREEGLWARVYSEDLQSLVDGLRAAGFRHTQIERIVRTMVDERDRARRMTLVDEREALSYWRSPGSSPPSNEVVREYERQRESDMRVIRQLALNPEYLRDDASRREQISQRFGELSEEKIQHLLQIENDYGELLQQASLSKDAGPEARAERLRMLFSERERDIQGALTDEEYQQYELRSGATANYLRGQLDHFQPSEGEFKTPHALYESVRLQFPQVNPDEETMRAQRQAMEALESKVAAAFGPERYADFRQTLQEGSQKVNNLLVRLDLPLRTGGRIEEVRLDLSQRAEAVRADVALAPAERAARMAGLQQEARQRVAETLGGERNLAAYEEIKGWIRDLK